jgi:hypothetical protein
MRNAIAVCLLALVSLAAAAATLEVKTVDLDKPGALDALARDRPAHYRKVMEEIEKAQAIHVDPVPVTRDARMDERSKDATIILPSDPAKKRISVFVDLIEYRVTAHMTKDPARFQKAR